MSKCEYKKGSVECGKDHVDGCGIRDKRTGQTIAKLCQEHHDRFWYNIVPFLEV